MTEATDYSKKFSNGLSGELLVWKKRTTEDPGSIPTGDIITIGGLNDYLDSSFTRIKIFLSVKSSSQLKSMYARSFF